MYISPLFTGKSALINVFAQLKMPRILSLISESHPEENEVQSEAQFQRLVASCSELPFQPRTPRAASDRGRYPEEAGEEEQRREETPSDDGEFDELPYASVEPINIVKPSTPAQSVNGDDMGMLDSPGGMAMDVDVVCDAVVPALSVLTRFRFHSQCQSTGRHACPHGGILRHQHLVLFGITSGNVRHNVGAMSPRS